MDLLCHKHNYALHKVSVTVSSFTALPAVIILLLNPKPQALNPNPEHKIMIPVTGDGGCLWRPSLTGVQLPIS